MSFPCPTCPVPGLLSPHRMMLKRCRPFRQHHGAQPPEHANEIMPEPKCQGQKADGSPCGAPSELVDPDTGYCPAHDPEKGSETMAERGRKGGSRSPYEERLDKLPEITCAANVLEILNRAIRATAQGTISEKRANSIARLCRAWARLNDVVAAEERLDDIETKLAELDKVREKKPWQS